MISEALRADIESWASRTNERPLFHMAQSGRLTKAMVTRYIANATYLCRHTTSHLVTARDGAIARGDKPLAEYYAHKFGEEQGHAKWGDADLESLTSVVAAPATSLVVPAIAELNAYLGQIIAHDPALYLPYIAFAEYVTALVGPALLTNIENHCGVPRTSMTVIDNHIELDRDHAEESFAIIDDLVGDPRKLGTMRRALQEMARYYDRFCEEVTTVTEAAHESERTQVSAA